MALTREEHLAFCKQRAHEYVDAGLLAQAVASMGSDLNKHPETRSLVSPAEGLTMPFASEAIVRRWIEGFK